MALTFDQYVKNKEQEAKNSGKLTFDQYVKQTPVSSTANPVDLLPKPEGNGYVSVADLNRQSNGSGTGVSLAGARGTFRNNYGYGNLDLTDRPIYVNPDGSYSTVRSLSVGFDDDTVLIPTVGWDANRNPVSWTEDEAIQHYLQTGEHLGKFATVEAADQYGQWLHNQQEAYYNNNPTVVALRDRQNNGKSTVAPGTPGGGGRGVNPPTFWERVVNVFTGAGKQYAGTMADVPSVIVDARGGTVANELYEEQLADVKKRRDALAAAMAADPQYAIDPEAIWQLQQYDKQLGILGQSITANQNTGAAARDVAQQLTQSGAADVERASEGLGTAGKFLVNTGVAGLQMAGDVALGALTGGGNMAPMLMRSFGGGTQEARSKGYSTNQQLALGLTSAATEYFTEKLFGGNPIYDKADVGLVNKAINAVLQRIDPSVASRVMSVLSSTGVEMLNEGWEEVASDLLNPMMEQIITGNHDPVTLEQLVEDWAVGVALGGMGTGSTAAVEAVGNAPTKTTNAAINNAYAAAEQYGMFSPEARAAAEAATKKTEKAERRARRDNGYYQNVLPTPEEYEENAAAQSGELFGSMGQEAVRAIVDTGLESATGTESRTLAEQYAKKLDAGETLTEQEIGKLYRANLDAIQQEALQQGLSAQEYTTEQRTPMEVRKAELRNQSDLETLAAGTMGAEGLKLAAEKRGTMADTDPVAYYNEARQAYDMGRTGEENTFKGEILSTKEANAWYNAGIYDAKEETNEQRQSGNESQGRVDGLDSQRQGGRLAEGAGGQLAGEAAEGQRDGGSPVQANDGASGSRKEAAVKLGQAQPLTSAAESGISSGTAAKTMHYIPEDTMDQWHPEMVEVYNKGKQNGITVKYYTGRMALDDGHGVFFVRGLNVGDGSVVWIRADADEDIRKIADHEFFHTAEKRDPGLKQRILDKITENKQAKTLQALTQKYADKYDGSGLSDEEILSEICADSYGGIDIFAGITDAKDATEEQKARATDLSETVRGAVQESKPKATSNESAKGIDRASREIGLPETERKTLEKNNATVADGVVIADTLAPVMESPEFHKPVSVSDLADLASHDTLPAWAEKYINGGGSKEALKAIQHFDDIIWKSVGGNASDAQKLLQELVPSGNIKAGKFGPLRENVEYRRSFDMDTSCPRTFQFVEYRNAIQKRINRTLTFEESVNLINLMAAYHQMIPCTYCYVENKRILKASYYNKFYAFHNAVMNGISDGLDVEDLKPLMYGWDAEKKKLTSAAEKVLTEEWMTDKSGYNPTIEENYHTVNLIRNAAMHLLDGMRDERKINANTTIKSLTNIIASEYGIKSKEALKEVEKMAEDWQYDVSRNAEHMYLVPDIGEEFDRKIADRALALDNEAIGYANSASSAKSVDNYVPYGGELENISDEDRDFIIGMGGIRKHSSNDFRIDYVLDYFQFFADLAKGKWTGHTYTKSADYVRIFGRTGDMINMSIAFNDTADGVSENVNEGMEHKLAQELRKAYANAGVMAMVTSDKQLSYALNADWVDMIIPFHNSGLPKEIWYNMKAWTDYTSVQSEALYNGDEMKAALSSRGIDTKGMKADQVRDLFYQTFGIKQVVKQEDKDKKNIGKQFAPHFYPYETKQYGVTIPGHDNSKSKYLALCREYGVHPRFDGVIVKDAEGKDINIVDHPNYMKVVREASRATENFKQPAIEFSFNKADPYLTEKYGNEYGKKSVTPMDYAMARLNEEAGNGGYKNAAEDQFGIVDEFVRDYAGKGRSIGWLSERAGMVKDELDSVQDKIVDANRKATLEEFKETAGEKAKPKVRSNFYTETNMASREEGYDYYSREVDDDAMLKRLNNAEQEGVRDFKDIKPGDQKGVVKVYRAMQAQPVDESGNVIPNASVRRIVSYDPLMVEAKVFTGTGRNKKSEIITAPAKLFSPMAGQTNGVWRNPIALNKWEMSEGHPELATTQIDEKTGKPKIDTQQGNASYGEVAYWYGLNKGGVDDNGKAITRPVPARYNPYTHTSLSALNDQFSAAEKRPELVTVETLIPVWHINNGENNERLPLAKDRVGAMSWHSGPTSSRLAKIGKARTVILTRYDKPVRVVPDAEVAKSIAENIGDSKNVAIPSSVVTPSLAKELRAQGVSVLDNEAWKEYADKYPTEKFAKLSGNMASRDTDYMDAVERGDMETAQRMVDEAAKAAGFDTPKLYHGTPSFGFTQLRGIMFATDSKETAGTYSGTSEPRNINDANGSSLGMYQLYANTDQMLEFDAVGAETNHIALGQHENDFNKSQEFKSWRSFATINQLIKYAKENNYTGVIVKNVIDSATPESRQTLGPATDYVFFDPKSQVRSADPVTYDDNGNVIPLSERFNPENKDIRYSREDDTNRLMQENTDLRQRLDVALADTKQTKAWRANTKDVTRVAEDIIAATRSKESKPIVEQKIRSLVEAASNGGIDSTEMKDLALDIARGLLKRSSVLTTKDSTTYDGMRDYLKSVYINVPSEMRKEITDWKAFAAAHKAMRMKTTGVAINEVYKEMQKRMGKDYFPDIDSDIDKLRQIAEVLDTLTPVYDNPYSVNMAEATEETANSILESVLNIGQAEPTYADRAKARKNEVRELYQQKLADQKAYLQQRIQDEADKRKQQTEAVKQHYTEMQENRRLRKQDSEARQKLLRVANRLQNRKLDAVNRAMVDQLIGDLDTVSVNLTNRSLTNLRELADWYDSYKDDPNFLSDPQVEKKLSRLEKRHIGEMTLDEVRDLTDVLRSIENALATYGKMVRIEDHRLISEMSEQSQENIRNTKGSKKNIADWLVTNTLAPERLLRRLTGYNDSDPLYMRVKELSEGQRKMMDYQMRAEALFSKWTNDKKLIERLRDKETVKVRAFVDGKETTVEITPDMRMALYLHGLNDQNLKHIMNGGIRIPDIELYRKGDTKEAYSRGVTAKMSPDMVRGIANGMSAEERAFANAAKAYFNGMSRDEINAVSEALLGYSLANVENYFPIQTDDAFTMKEIDAIQNDGSIQGMGFTKERQNASNAIYLVPMTNVLKRSIQNHAKYVGMAIPVANMNRLWMANTKDGETDTTSGLKDTMRSKWGDRANEAVEKILTDVQNPVRKTDDVSKALAKVRSNYAGAVLTLNASVAMKQAASYPTAAAVLGWEPLLKAMKNYGKVNLDLIAKYTPLQWYRSQGFSTQELGDIKSQSGLMDKVLSAHITTKDGREVPLLNWIQGIDLMTTRKLWKASEYYVQQNQKDLKPGTDDYYKAVADIYNRVIEETQPNYTTMQRPQLLRSDNQLLQSLVMFKTQPFQNFNILYDAIGELRAAETMAKNGDPSKLKQARQNAVNAVTSNLVSAVVFAAMTMAWALARRKREKYEDDEGNFSPWGQLGKDILSSELGMIPFGSDAYNLLASMFLGEKYYGMTNITSDSLSGMTESTLNAFNTLKETVTALLDDDEKTQADPEKIARKLFATAKGASKLLGIPTENVLNLMTAVYSNVASAVNGEYTTAYEVLRLEKGFTSSSSKSTAYDILYKAYQNDRSQYNELRGMMVDDGFKESSIDSAMKKRSSK